MILLPIGYILTVVLANWLVERYGVVPVGFGQHAPAAVYAAGLALTLRDLVQERYGRALVLVCIVAGALVSLAIAPAFAIASAVAFLVSELVDFAVYTPLRVRGLVPALAASNAVGLVIDSLLFLWIAFGSYDLLFGQIIGKTWATIAAIVVIALVRAHGSLSLGSRSRQSAA